ncbi:YceI family protein [Ruegeria lacuscaerulensis]|uniref:YceI family protein n=1 Tax=Ruegeria lacuscaerulensis TaxID=55218 RepID=UPI00147CAE48|nr:YceI family protein [Ruegeria lacuscaerulensis]
MTSMTRRTLLAGLATLSLTRSADAALTPYRLEPKGTSVVFTFDLSGLAQSGTMPIQSADIRIDLANLANSRVKVELNVAKARTKLPLARQPMLSREVLDAATYPTILFVSTKVQLGDGGRISRGARITGDLTVRGVTRPITLRADLYRKPGSAADSLDDLSIRLTGALNRHDFGASGYADLVRDTVGLDIRAEIKRVG